MLAWLAHVGYALHANVVTIVIDSGRFLYSIGGLGLSCGYHISGQSGRSHLQCLSLVAPSFKSTHRTSPEYDHDRIEADDAGTECTSRGS